MIPVKKSNAWLKKIVLQIENGNASLGLDTDESYSLDIPHRNKNNKSVTGTIKSKTVFGALRGLETLSQLVNYDKSIGRYISYGPWHIEDKPSYKHRGFMLDVTRNWFSVDELKTQIDALSWNKFNVLHLHLSDAQSFSLASEVYPQLRAMAYDRFQPGMIYTKKDMLDLVGYALERGIRIIPEIEMPGHAYATALPFPGMMVCANVQPVWRAIDYQPPSGQFDVTQDITYEVTENLIKEVASWFPDQLIHTGGDEVGMRCYKESEVFQKNLKEKNMTVVQAMQHFYDKVDEYVTKAGKRPIVWEEALLNKDLNLTIPKHFIVQQWTGSKNTKVIVSQGHDIIQSGSDYWYLDVGHGRHAPGWVDCPTCDKYRTWQKIYSHDLRANLTEAEGIHVLGGEAAMWTEQIDSYNLNVQMWPRAAAAAEVLWSGYSAINYTDIFGSVKRAFPRLNEWRYRMGGRGIKGAAIAPLWCVKQMGWCDLPAGYEA
ncbi:glycoside hydrolase family 20 protein [Basidiobolus meristosporus CBS 931.73]|uniref:Beta-hexosaminidase n=1 Tax=Basidiobolus meristosporus CBS 931.73 TaxID=1314790 RepID=A0A1Y1XNN4_9FUNG|nr:glycoside hydrolase family 20 protein [Basidiobolus meristosporus CBS 931.73]|eukprot:ORX87359.1 glycoside hydrolase family 20 protein [Basidiobolus meristosporus CBS 931.73]